MTYARLFVSCALVLGAVTSAVGCAGQSSEDSAASSDNAITGVTDLSEMEAALGLWADTKNAQGNYERPEAKLEAGPCYKKLMIGASAGAYEFRRYTSGAAFFKKQGDGAASGAERPVVCVDVDVDASQNGDGAETIAVSDIEVDAVLRYRLGAPTGGDGAAGTFYDDFANGTVSYHDGYCPQTGFDPLAPDALSLFCFGEVNFPGNSQASGALELLVYQFAYKTGKATNRFSMAADPVGRFVSMEGDYQNQTLHFEHVDGHASTAKDGSSTSISITPKNSTVAIVSCTLTATDNENYDVKCTGAGF